MGAFAHDMGEGGISRYNRENGGDLILFVGNRWEFMVMCEAMLGTQIVPDFLVLAWGRWRR